MIDEDRACGVVACDPISSSDATLPERLYGQRAHGEDDLCTRAHRAITAGAVGVWPGLPLLAVSIVGGIRATRLGHSGWC